MNRPDHRSYYMDALRVVLEERRASLSLLQRRLRCGFGYCQRLLEDMEADGYVSGPTRSGERHVLISRMPRLNIPLEDYPLAQWSGWHEPSAAQERLEDIYTVLESDP